MKRNFAECPCPKQRIKKNPKGIASFFSALCIALIPKCPFCILTYTSAITICSRQGLAEYTPHWTSWISIALAAITLIITLYNYKGQRTWVAGSLVMVGSLLLIYSELISGLAQPYYWGCGILIFGVWVNGSLPYVIRFIFPFIKFKAPFSLVTNNQ